MGRSPASYRLSSLRKFATAAFLSGFRSPVRWAAVSHRSSQQDCWRDTKRLRRLDITSWRLEYSRRYVSPVCAGTPRAEHEVGTGSRLRPSGTRVDERQAL